MPNAFQMTQAWVNYWTQTDTSGTNIAIDVTVSSSPAAASSADNGAIAGTVKTNGSQNLTGSIKAGSFTSVGAGTGTAVLINGVTISASNTGHTTLTTVSGQSISVTTSTGTVTTVVGTDITAGATGGTVTNVIGARVNTPAISTITPTNVYGLYIDTISGGTNNFAIFVAGGSVRLNALTASEPLALDSSKNIVSRPKAHVSNGNSSTAKTIDLSTSENQLLTMTGNCTLTLSNPIIGVEYKLYLTQDATGSRLMTWPGTVKWPAATAPTLTTTASKTDIIRLIWDGTNYHGSTVALNYA